MEHVLGTPVDVTTYDAAAARVMDWARRCESRIVCVANVHLVMESYDRAQLRSILGSADLVVPDGTPLVWFLRLRGQRIRERVYGPDLMRQVLAVAERDQIAVGLYGSTPEVEIRLAEEIAARHPRLKIAFQEAPPMRDLTAEEDRAVEDAVNRSGARILFVGLGCPKQELWMAAHRGRIQAVMLGVGAAFDFLAGTKPQAPRWIQNLGLEWLFRLAHEPRRLARRYLYHNPRFLALASAQLIGLWRR